MGVGGLQLRPILESAHVGPVGWEEERATALGRDSLDTLCTLMPAVVMQVPRQEDHHSSAQYMVLQELQIAIGVELLVDGFVDPAGLGRAQNDPVSRLHR